MENSLKTDLRKTCVFAKHRKICVWQLDTHWKAESDSLSNLLFATGQEELKSINVFLLCFLHIIPYHDYD